MAGTRGQDDVVIRQRVPTDDAAISYLNEAAFGGSYESRLIEDLRAGGLAAIELVAEEETAIVGHILFGALSVTLDGEEVRTLALAPMSVRPDRQQIGIGSALVRQGLDLARHREWEAVMVLGHADYYPRFGFSAAVAARLQAPFSGPAFMALELASGALSGRLGRVVYPPAFGLGPG